MKAMHSMILNLVFKSDCRVYHSPDEASPEEHRAWHLHQAAGGGEGEKRQLRSRCLRAGEGVYHHHYHCQHLRSGVLSALKIFSFCKDARTLATGPAHPHSSQ